MSLPINPDLGPARGSRGRVRIPHHRLPSIGLVFVGGCCGTLIRESFVLAAGTTASQVATTLAINLAGALLLAIGLEVLVSWGDDTGPRRTLRLLFGTGLLGGFTTYSAFATDAAFVMVDGRWLTGVAYVGATIVGGAVCTAVGLAVGARLMRERVSP